MIFAYFIFRITPIKIFKKKTGLYGFGLEVACLTLCVASVWAPGSPFDPASVSIPAISDPFTVYNATSSNSTTSHDEGPESYTSVILLMSGILSARFGIFNTEQTRCTFKLIIFLKLGLWVADLSVNQVLQEVDDQIRGTVNGVQSSMNMIFDTAKFLLVIACPWPTTYGILVCISFAAICAGYVFVHNFQRTKWQIVIEFVGGVSSLRILLRNAAIYYLSIK